MEELKDRLIIQKTRQYAKRQFTWAKRAYAGSWEKIYSPDAK